MLGAAGTVQCKYSTASHRSATAAASLDSAACTNFSYGTDTKVAPPPVTTRVYACLAYDTKGGHKPTVILAADCQAISVLMGGRVRRG